METLEEWHFDQYMDSLSKRAMNQNVKHVMKVFRSLLSLFSPTCFECALFLCVPSKLLNAYISIGITEVSFCLFVCLSLPPFPVFLRCSLQEGGRAGKALLVNTESLVSTVQVLGAASGAAKAAQVMTVTTGVMSGLFLALDVFFLAKDSMELRKGARTEFAAKLREVCKELQDGLLELNHIKEELQKTMDGIEVEVEEEDEDDDDDEEDEDEEEDDEGELLKSDPKKLASLEE